jgi:hypothetical protein
VNEEIKVKLTKKYLKNGHHHIKIILIMVVVFKEYLLSRFYLKLKIKCNFFVNLARIKYNSYDSQDLFSNK